MGIDHLAFVLTTALAWAYLATARRSIDVFTLAALSGTLFFFPAYFGVLSGPPGYPSRPVEPELYFTFSIYMGLVLASAFLADTLFRHGSTRAPIASDGGKYLKIDAIAMFALILLLGTTLAVALSTHGMGFLQGTKRNLLAAESGWLQAFHWLSSVVAVSLLLRGGIAAKVTAFAVLLLTVMAGSRAPIAMTAAALLLIYGSRRGPVSLIGKYTIAAPLAAAGSIFVGSLLKPAYTAFRAGGLTAIGIIFSREPIGQLASRGAEFMGTQYIFNEIVRTGFATDGGHMLRAPLSLLPIPRRLYTTASSEFNDLFQPILFADRSSGMAYNPFGEAYAALGLSGVGILLVIGTLMLLSLHRLLQFHRATKWAPLVALAAAVLVFYGHRSSVGVSLGLIRNMLWPYAGSLLLAWLVRRVPRTGQQPHSTAKRAEPGLELRRDQSGVGVTESLPRDAAR